MQPSTIESGVAFVERLRGAVQRHDLAPPPELPLFRIELKLVEFVDESGVGRHDELSDQR